MTKVAEAREAAGASLLEHSGGLGLSTYGTGVDIPSDILHKGGPPVFLSDGVDGARNSWMSSDNMCVPRSATNPLSLWECRCAQEDYSGVQAPSLEPCGCPNLRPNPLDPRLGRIVLWVPSGEEPFLNCSCGIEHRH